MAYFFQNYVDQYGADKTAEWANELIRYFRTYATPLINATVAEKNMKTILSDIDVGKVMMMFKDPSKLQESGWEIIPIVVIEKIRNILIGERVEAGLSVNVHALDAAAQSDRDADKTLLKNRKNIEDLVSWLNDQLGLRPYKISEEKAAGKNPYKGNADLFDSLGLSADDEAQMSYFFEVWHKLFYEMDAQEIINYLFSFNSLELNIDKWVNDILAKKRIALQVYINELSGAFEARYLAPEQVSLIPGKRKDGKDSACIIYEERITVSELLKRMGNYIDLERDWQMILWAVNYYNKTEFTGIFDSIDADRSQRRWFGSGDLLTAAVPGGPDKSYVNGERVGVNMSDFLNYKVSMGYIEWKSWDKRTIKKGTNYHGNTAVYPFRGGAGDDSMPNESKYAKETEYFQYTYRAYFVPTSSLTQFLVSWGKLPYQVIEGAQDDISNYSIIIRSEAGPTVAEICQPFIDLVQESFTKKRWMIRRAKPKGRAYNYDSMVKVATKMYGTGNKAANIQTLIKMWEEGVNELYVIPTTERGERVGGGVLPNYDLPNGLDPTAIQFKDIIDWCVAMIKDQLGITPLREAFSPKPNDGLRLQQEAKKASEYSTNYINTMIDGLSANAAERFMMSVIDVVKYKGSLAYNFLKSIIGSGGIKRIQSLDNIALHRYGIFINGFSTFLRRQEVKADTQQAFLNKEITYEVKFLIDSVDDYRKAALILAYSKQLAQKREDQQAQMEQQNAMQLEELKHKNVMDQILAKGQLDNKGKAIQGFWQYKSNLVAAQIKAGMQSDKLAHDAEKTEQKMQADLQFLNAEHDLKEQDAVPGY